MAEAMRAWKVRSRVFHKRKIITLTLIGDLAGNSVVGLSLVPLKYRKYVLFCTASCVQIQIIFVTKTVYVPLEVYPYAAIKHGSSFSYILTHRELTAVEIAILHECPPWLVC